MDTFLNNIIKDFTKFVYWTNSTQEEAKKKLKYYIDNKDIIIKILCDISKYTKEIECVNLEMYGIEINLDMEIFNDNFEEIKTILYKLRKDIYNNNWECKKNCCKDIYKLHKCNCKGTIKHIEL